MKKEKLKVDTQTKNALDTLLSAHDEDKILELHIKVGHEWCGDAFRCLNTLSNPQMAQALYTGYEEGKTPEEKALNYYNFLPIENKEVVKRFLEILEYRLEGIN